MTVNVQLLNEMVPSAHVAIDVLVRHVQLPQAEGDHARQGNRHRSSETSWEDREGMT